MGKRIQREHACVGKGVHCRLLTNETNLRPLTALLGFWGHMCDASFWCVFEFTHWWVGSCKPPLITHSMLWANSQLQTSKKCNLLEHGLGASTVRLQAVGAFGSPLALPSLDITWMALGVAQLAAPFNEKWISPCVLPFQHTLYAPALNIFFSRICLRKTCFYIVSLPKIGCVNNPKDSLWWRDLKPLINEISVNLGSEIVSKCRAMKFCRWRDEFQANSSSNIYQNKISGVLNFATKDVIH